MTDVAGYCPMGCGKTLFVGASGHVTCSFVECPNPGAVDEILADQETEHIVRIEEEGFSIQHPLRERVGGELLDCQLHAEISALGGPPAKPGVYRAVRWAPDPVSQSYRGDAIGWDFVEITGSEPSR